MAKNVENGAISSEFLAKILGLTVQRLGQLEKSGVLVRVGHGRWDGPASVQKYLDYKVQSEIEARYGTFKPGDELTDPGERVKFERARLLQLKNDETERLSLPTDLTLATIDYLFGQLRMEFTGLPSQLSPDVAERRRIETAVDAIFGRLSAGFAAAGAALAEGRDPHAADATNNDGSMEPGKPDLPAA
jgi:hypothetical protein